MRVGFRKKWLIGGVLIAIGILIISFLKLKEFSVYFYTPEEVFTKKAELFDKQIRLGGMVKPGSKIWNPDSLDLVFVLTDFKEHEFTVQYKGTPPDMFKENSGVVCEGRLTKEAGLFVATSLMVKHSEEYKIPDATHSVDRELIEKSMLSK